MAASKRGNPVDSAHVRVGNYAADVDTAGLDPAMKDTMYGSGEGAKPKNLFADAFSKMFGAKHTPKPQPKTGPITPAQPDTMSRAAEDSLSKKYLGR